MSCHQLKCRVLRQEEELRQQTRLGLAGGTTLGILTAVSALSVFALQSRYQATRALEDSMFAAGSMVLQSQRLPAAEKHELGTPRNRLISQGCDLIDKLSVGAGRTPQITEMVVCRIERALARESLGEHDRARALYEEAAALAVSRYASMPRSDAARSHARVLSAYANYLARQKRTDEAVKQLTLMQTAMLGYQKKHSGNEDFLESEAHAWLRLGEIHEQLGERKRAAQAFDNSARVLVGLAEMQTASNKIETLAWRARMQRSAGQQFVETDDKKQAITRFQAAIATLAGIPATEQRPDWLNEAAAAHAYIFNLQRKLGNTAAAAKARQAAIGLARKIVADKRSPKDLREKARSLNAWLEKQAE